MSIDAASRHLLFGLLALQNDLIDRTQLLAAFSRRIDNKAQSLDELLVEAGALDAVTREALAAMVACHIARHGNDVAKSLASLTGPEVAETRVVLSRIGDSDLHASCLLLPCMTPLPAESLSGAQWNNSAERFRVLRPLPGGQGGMGIIVIARDEELGREVALKQILPDKVAHAEYRRKFQFEAEVTGNLEHPGIVPVYGLGTDDDGRPFYAMRLVQGNNLAEGIRQFHAAQPKGPHRFGSVEFLGLLDRLLDVAQAVHYANSRGVLHRDLKPGNILLGAYGETLVIDWGLARLRAESTDQSDPGGRSESSPFVEGEKESGSGLQRLRVHSGDDPAATLQGSFLGTPGYASPEQVRGMTAALDQRSDVYSLGAILYQMLTSELPIVVRGRTAAQILEDTAHGRIRVPRELDRTVPKALNAICLKALASDPTDRYQSAGELVSDLERWKADEQVSALPETMLTRSSRWLRRHRGVAATGFASLMILTLLSTAAAIVINRHRLLAERARQQADHVTDFLVSVFRSPDPAAAGREIQVVDLLIPAELDLRNQSLDPMTQIRLNDALAGAYRGLGWYDRAAQQYRTAHQRAMSELGADYPETWELATSLGIALHDAGKAAEAVRWLEYVKDQILSAGASSPQFLRLRLRVDEVLGSAMVSAGQRAEGVALLRSSIARWRVFIGEDSPEFLTAMNNLAETLNRMGESAEARQLLETVLSERRRVLGDNHPDTLTAMNNLAVVLKEGNQLAAARTLFEQTLATRRNKLGDWHPDTQTSLNNLATLLNVLGEYQQAAEMLTEALAGVESVLGPEHPTTLAVMENVANAMRRAGQLQAALDGHRETVRRKTQKLGPDHPETLIGLNNLGTVLIDLELATEAVELYEDLLPRLTAAADSDAAAAAVNNFAAALELTGRHSEAREKYQMAMDLYVALFGEEDPRAMTAINNYGYALSQEQRTDEAREVFARLLSIRRQVLGEDHPDTLVAGSNLAVQYESLGRMEEAAELYESISSHAQNVLQPDDPVRLLVLGTYASFLYTTSRLPEARLLFDDLLQRFSGSKGEDHSQTLNVLENLATVCRGLGDFEASLKLTEELVRRLRRKGDPDEKVPDSLVRIALDQLELNQPDAARQSFTEAHAAAEAAWEANSTDVAWWLAGVSVSLLADGQSEWAEPLLRISLDIRQREIPDHWSTFNTLSMLGECLLTQREFTAAEPMLVDGFVGMRDRLSTIPDGALPRLREAGIRLIRLYQLWNRPEDAERWQEELKDVP